MRIVILIAVAETSIFMLWLTYWYQRGRQSNLRTAIRQPRSTAGNGSLLLSPSHWSTMNRSQVEGQQDDRLPMNGSVVTAEETAPSVRRALARKSHQVMYKKWSQDRHDD
jgi:hypothetical protein